MSFGTHDQVILTGLGGHRTAQKFNGMRGVIVQTKTYYLKKGMHTVLVLPESGGKAQALTVKAKYLRAYVGGGGGHADDASVIIETYGRSKTEKYFGMPLGPPKLRLELLNLGYKKGAGGGWFWPEAEHNTDNYYGGWHIHVDLEEGKLNYMGITSGGQGANFDIYRDGAYVPNSTTGYPWSGADDTESARHLWATAVDHWKAIQ